MSVYTPFIALAQRLITKWGMNCNVYAPVNGAPVVPGQDWKPTNGTPVIGNIRLVFFPEETINYYSKTKGLVMNEQYQIGYEYYLAPTGFEPELNQVVDKAGTKFRVKYVQKYAPAGEVVLYIVGLKQ
jgi:hypothetical protein